VKIGGARQERRKYRGVIEMPFLVKYAMIESGELKDAKTKYAFRMPK
jgi:hypothetical protein